MRDRTPPPVTLNPNSTVPGFSSLPSEARDWLTTLPWQQRRYVLSLCHLVCATPSAQQAEFLDAYTAEGLLSRIVDDDDTRQRVNKHLARFHCGAAIDDTTVRKYIRQGVCALCSRRTAAARSVSRDSADANGGCSGTQQRAELHFGI